MSAEAVKVEAVQDQDAAEYCRQWHRRRDEDAAVLRREPETLRTDTDWDDSTLDELIHMANSKLLP